MSFWNPIFAGRFVRRIRPADLLRRDGTGTAAVFPAAVLLIAAVVSTAVDAAEVTVICGTGAAGYTGDGGSATEATADQPFGLTTGPDGCLYVCEVGNHVIRRIDLQSGEVTTFAGTGRKGYSGNGGPAAAAAMNEPYEVQFDRHGNLYVVEMQNHIVRRIEAGTGTIQLVAGSGEPGFAGDGGPATEARLNRPHSICLDDRGHLYICDIGNHRIRVVDPETGIISTWCGNGQRDSLTESSRVSADTALNGPRALAFDAQRNRLVLALREGNAVYSIDLATMRFEHLAGTGRKGYSGDGGPASESRLSGPKGVAVNSSGDVFIADTESHTIRVIRAADGSIETVIGDGAVGPQFHADGRKCRTDRPHGVCIGPAGALFVGDSNNHRVLMLR